MDVLNGLLMIIGVCTALGVGMGIAVKIILVIVLWGDKSE